MRGQWGRGMWLTVGANPVVHLAGHGPGRSQAMGPRYGYLLDWKSYGNSECEAVPALLPDLQR